MRITNNTIDRAKILVSLLDTLCELESSALLTWWEVRHLGIVRICTPTAPTAFGNPRRDGGRDRDVDCGAVARPMLSPADATPLSGRCLVLDSRAAAGKSASYKGHCICFFHLGFSRSLNHAGARQEDHVTRWVPLPVQKTPTKGRTLLKMHAEKPASLKKRQATSGGTITLFRCPPLLVLLHKQGDQAQLMGLAQSALTLLKCFPHKECRKRSDTTVPTSPVQCL